MTTVNGNYVYDEDHYLSFKIEGNHGVFLKIIHYRDEEYNLIVGKNECESFESVANSRQLAIELMDIQLSEGARLLEQYKQENAPIKIKDDIVDCWFKRGDGQEEQRILSIPWSIQQKGSAETIKYIDEKIESIEGDEGFIESRFTQTF